MKPLRDWEKSELKAHSLSVVAFDLDDTLTEKGELSSQVISELEAVGRAGWKVVLVTGRPAGWADSLIKLLPFDGIVAENGAVLLSWTGGRRSKTLGEEPKKLFWTTQGYAGAYDSHVRLKLDQHREKILQAVPRSQVASDQMFRLYDLAIDFAEEVMPPLSFDDAKKIQKAFESFGFQAKISSIHVNGWDGTFSKVDGLRQLLRDWDTQLSPENNLLYVGDSPNDGPLFEVAAMSVGVANVQDFGAEHSFSRPSWVTQKKSADGSIELLGLLRSWGRRI
jgi:HAD superfamily hydrolase (TIGR01484 family)